jgi:hypothetical protein
MKVAVTAKVIFDDRHGRLNKGAVIDMIDHKAKFFLARGEVELYETKVIRESPSMAVGAPLSASPPAPASQPQTLSESVYGVKKRGRPKKGE